MRKYWIDEWPQFWNILVQRNMKMVGIRPMREVDWSRYPEDLKKRALNYKPGLFGPQYAFPRTEDFESNVEYLRQYLDEYEESPFKTDMKYFLQISKKIAEGMRSS